MIDESMVAIDVSLQSQHLLAHRAIIWIAAKIESSKSSKDLISRKIATKEMQISPTCSLVLLHRCPHLQWSKRRMVGWNIAKRWNNNDTVLIRRIGRRECSIIVNRPTVFRWWFSLPRIKQNVGVRQSAVTFFRSENLQRLPRWKCLKEEMRTIKMGKEKDRSYWFCCSNDSNSSSFFFDQSIESTKINDTMKRERILRICQ